MMIAVTGATGYIGRRLIYAAQKAGHDVLALSRHSPNMPHVKWSPYDLADANSLALPRGTCAVIHLAANTQRAQVGEKLELEAANRLIEAAKAIGAVFIFVSSQTAQPSAPTDYGRVKWQIEQATLAAGGVVVRPGQVYGGELRGLYGSLARLVLKLPLLPAFIPSPKIQPIHVDDLAEGLLRIAERGDVEPTIYSLAAPVSVPFTVFLGEIAKSRLRCRRLWVPVPVVGVNFVISLIGETWRTRLGLARLRSLFDLPSMATAEDLFQLQLSLRSLSAGLHPSGDDRRRCLLREGQALLAYVLKERPGSGLLRRYVRAIESLRGGQLFGLPSGFINYPILMSLLDRASWSDAVVAEEFIWRLDAATILAEASPEGARRFLGAGSERGLPSSVFSMTLAITGELFWRLLRALFFPVLRFGMARVKGVL